MLEYWQVLIATLGGSAVLLLAVGFLVRNLITHLLSKDVERFKADLQHNATIQLERALIELRQQTLEHEVRFRHLHEKRSLVIAELYSRIVEAIQKLEYAFQPVEWFNQPPRNKKLEEAQPALYALHQYFEQHRILFPELLAANVHSFIEKLGGWFHEYQIWSEMADDELAKQNKIAAVRTAWKGLKDEVPVLKLSLETEFRKLLQV